MARIGNKLLDAGEIFPRLDLKLDDGAPLVVPEGLKSPWNIVLFYRGLWCHFCRAQLKSYQEGLAALTAEGIGVLAASVEPLEKAAETRAATGATFPIAYGLDVLKIAEITGAYYDDNPHSAPAPHLQATGFLLSPGGKIVTAAYSSNVLGRLGWEDALFVVKKLKEMAAAQAQAKS